MNEYTDGTSLRLQSCTPRLDRTLDGITSPVLVYIHLAIYTKQNYGTKGSLATLSAAINLVDGRLQPVIFTLRSKIIPSGRGHATLPGPNSSFVMIMTTSEPFLFSNSPFVKPKSA